MRQPVQQQLFAIPVDVRRLRDEDRSVLEAIDKLGAITLRHAGRIVYRLQNRRSPPYVDGYISAGWRVIKRLRAHGLVSRKKNGQWGRPADKKAAL